MGRMVCRQPNGKYCVFSSVVDCPTHYNLTEEEYIEMRAQEAREEAKRELEYRTRNFGNIIECYKPYNMSVDDFTQALEDMGFDGNIDEKIEEWRHWFDDVEED